MALPKSASVVSIELRKIRADRVIDHHAWHRLSAGDGAHGPRVYKWAADDIRPLREATKGHWLLAPPVNKNSGSPAHTSGDIVHARLMERFGLDAERAFALLVRSSQSANMKLLAVAQWLTGSSPEGQAGHDEPAGGTHEP